MDHARHCPKCEGAMIEGYVADQGYGEATLPKWREGTPRKSMWVGLKLGGTTPIQVATWRCARCGYLESYAAGG